MAARRRWTNTNGGGVAVNTSELQSLIRDLRAVGGRTHRVYLREALVAAAKPVEMEAKRQASQHSQTIPPTIKTVAYASGVLVIKAGTKKVQLAALYEEGNAGRKPGSFKHPVFPRKGSDRSTWTWATQEGYPFLKPAAEVAMPAVDAAVGRVVGEMTAILARKASSLL